MNPQFWWFLTRSPGIVAWLMLTASVIWGILLSTKAFPSYRSPLWLLALHRWLGGLTMSFRSIHFVALVADNYVSFGLADITIPYATDWNVATRRRPNHFTGDATPSAQVLARCAPVQLHRLLAHQHDAAAPPRYSQSEVSVPANAPCNLSRRLGIAVSSRKPTSGAPRRPLDLCAPRCEKRERNAITRERSRCRSRTRPRLACGVGRPPAAAAHTPPQVAFAILEPHDRSVTAGERPVQNGTFARVQPSAVASWGKRAL